MEPLDFESNPPRSPRKELAGIVFTARVIDKLRAALPGGTLNGYHAFHGLSDMWKHGTNISLSELSAVIRDAPDEFAVVKWIRQQTTTIDKPALNAKFERLATDRIPESWRETFEATYPSELRERFLNVFDLLEADDRRLYSATVRVASKTRK